MIAAGSPTNVDVSESGAANVSFRGARPRSTPARGRGLPISPLEFGVAEQRPNSGQEDEGGCQAEGVLSTAVSHRGRDRCRLVHETPRDDLGWSVLLPVDSMADHRRPTIGDPGVLGSRCGCRRLSIRPRGPTRGPVRGGGCVEIVRGRFDTRGLSRLRRQSLVRLLASRRTGSRRERRWSMRAARALPPRTGPGPNRRVRPVGGSKQQFLMTTGSEVAATG